MPEQPVPESGTADTDAPAGTVWRHGHGRHVDPLRPQGVGRHDLDAMSQRPWEELPEGLARGRDTDVVVDCGWGRVVFGQTFTDHDLLAEVLACEQPGRRDICLYLPDAHVLVSRYPNDLFIDPSYTLRLWLHHPTGVGDPVRGITVRMLRDHHDAQEVNRLYAACSMVEADTDTLWDNQRTRNFTYLLATESDTGRIVGTVTGIDHTRCFADPEEGSSLWCLAVDPQCPIPGVGEALVRTLVDHFRTRGRSYMDLSVMHDNAPALALYEKLGFERVPVLAVKRKNPINEPLFVAGVDDDIEQLNPYARIIADEAWRRGITVEVIDAAGGYLRLTHGSRQVVTRESLSELTSAVAMSMCDNKLLCRRVLSGAGLQVPVGIAASTPEVNEMFLHQVGSVVVKPVRGEQGRGITVGITDPVALGEAIEVARRECVDVLIEQFHRGTDVRVVVIDGSVVAAAERLPASVLGTGRDTVTQLIAVHSRRRMAATGGEASIPVDGDTLSALAESGYSLDDVVPAGERVVVRRTANVHTGGTIHDITDVLHPRLAEVALAAAEAVNIPVCGVDLIVEAPDAPDHVVIEVNERPGLANHEPQPTAQRFVDLLFPSTR